VLTADVNCGGHVKDTLIFGGFIGCCGDVGFNLIDLFFLNVTVEEEGGIVFVVVSDS